MFGRARVTSLSVTILTGSDQAMILLRISLHLIKHQDLSIYVGRGEISIEALVGTLRTTFAVPKLRANAGGLGPLLGRQLGHGGHRAENSLGI